MGLRVIPPRMVDNNLRPDHSAVPKTQDPNYCRQPTLCLEVLTVYGTELRLFVAKVFPLLILLIYHI